MVTIGNGGTNEGEFHEGLNMASVRKWPLVTVVMNNQWAISVPEHNSYIVKTLSQRAKSYDMPGVRVDGNDLIAVNEVMQEVYDFVREGNGPVLVEMVTWRQGQHTTKVTTLEFTVLENLKLKKKNENHSTVSKLTFFQKNLLLKKTLRFDQKSLMKKLKLHMHFQKNYVKQQHSITFTTTHTKNYLQI